MDWLQKSLANALQYYFDKGDKIQAHLLSQLIEKYTKLHDDGLIIPPLDIDYLDEFEHICSRLGLNPTERRIYIALAKRRNRLFASSKLALSVWDECDESRIKSIRVYISSIRRSMNQNKDIYAGELITEFGLGYMLKFEENKNE